MFFEEDGNPDGAPLLLIHGFLSSTAQWDANRERLGEHYRLILVELFGHGRSPAPTDASAYSIETFVAELEAIRARCEVDRWWVCGQSLGGALAILYTLAAPSAVKGLIFTNSRAAFGLGRPNMSEEARPAARVSNARDLPVHPINASRLPEAIKQQLVEAADAMPVSAINQFLARRHTWRSTDRMAELDAPVLLVNGRWESAFQPSVEVAATNIRDLTVVSLEGGHAINAEQADGFNDAVIEFITVNERGSAAEPSPGLVKGQPC